MVYDIPPDAEEEQYSAIKLLPPAHTVVDLESGTDTAVYVTEEQDAAQGYIPVEAEDAAEESFSRVQSQAFGDGNTVCLSLVLLDLTVSCTLRILH